MIRTRFPADFWFDIATAALVLAAVAGVLTW